MCLGIPFVFRMTFLLKVIAHQIVVGLRLFWILVILKVDLLRSLVFHFVMEIVFDYSFQIRVLPRKRLWIMYLSIESQRKRYLVRIRSI